MLRNQRVFAAYICGILAGVLCVVLVVLAAISVLYFLQDRGPYADLFRGFRIFFVVFVSAVVPTVFIYTATSLVPVASKRFPWILFAIIFSLCALVDFAISREASKLLGLFSVPSLIGGALGLIFARRLQRRREKSLVASGAGGEITMVKGE